MTAIPRVRAGRTVDQYAPAVQAMLSQLDDPLTRVIRTDVPSPAAASRPFSQRLTPDSILVVTAGPYDELFGPEAQHVITEAATAVPHARAVVIDLRAAPVDPF